MRLLPADSLTLQTPDSLPVVRSRLAAHIEPPQTVRWTFSRNHKPYEGTLSETGFEIRRIIHYRNSFLPTIRGRFEVSAMGTTIHITMRLHRFVIAFLIIWFLAWYSFALPIGLSGSMPTPLAIQFLGMPIVMLIAFWGAFWAEAHRSRRDLSEILLGKPVTKTAAWLPNALQWGLVAVALIIGFLSVTGHLEQSDSSSSESLESVLCTHPSVHSPYCKFKQVYTLKGHPTAAALALSADGQTLVSGGTDKAIKVWDLKTGRLRTTLQSDSGQINAVAIAPDGKTVVSGSADHMVRIWDLTTHHPPRMLVGHPEEVTLVKITPDGKRVISGSYGAIKVWDLATGQLQKTFPATAKSETTVGPITLIDDAASRFNPIDINAVSNTVLISDRQLINLNTGQLQELSPDHSDNFFSGSFLWGSLSLDGKLGALEYSNPWNKFETRLKVQDTTTGMIQGDSQASFSHSFFERVPLAISRDRIFGSTGQYLKVWNLQTAQLEAALQTGWLSHLVVSADGKLLAGLAEDLDPNVMQIEVWRR